MYKKGFVFVSCIFLLFSCASKKTNTTQPSDASTGIRTKASQKPYTVLGQRYEPLPSHERFVQTGIASWYGKGFHGRKTSSGEKYDMYAMTAAHKTLPLGIYVTVHNTKNRRDIVVRVNDRGPFVKGRVIDLSFAAAKKLGIDVSGTAFVRVEALGYRQNDAGGKTKREYTEPPSYDIGNYTVQVGAFRDIRNANRLSEEMRKVHGFADIQATNLNGNLFYRVYVGRYSSLEAAETAERTFMEIGYSGSFVVSLD
jgi:rare lipoprotein A